VFPIVDVFSGATPILIAMLGSGGLIAAIVALLKLRPDINSAAVIQAQGAMEVMQHLVEDIERNRNYWQKRADECASRCKDLEDELHQARQMIRRLSTEDHI
jgi:threonine dehydratase